MQKLGQHFLTNRKALKNIAQSLLLTPDETILEIGGGHGELTRELVKLRPKKLIVVEKDPALAEALKNAFSKGEVQILTGDIRELLSQIILELAPAPYKIAGNIPYYLTGFLMRLIGELPHKPVTSIFTIQKEVALRILAEPGEMSRLGASVQFWARPSLVSFLPPEDFTPRPKVHSAVIKLESREGWGISPSRYYRMVHILFKQPRKTILNNLVEGLGKKRDEITKKLESINLLPTLRPEKVSIETVVALAKILNGSQHSESSSR